MNTLQTFTLPPAPLSHIFSTRPLHLFSFTLPPFSLPPFPLPPSLLPLLLLLPAMHNAFDRVGVMDNTYIIFASDNGGCPAGGGRNYPLRGTKGISRSTLTQNSIHFFIFFNASIIIFLLHSPCKYTLSTHPFHTATQSTFRTSLLYPFPQPPLKPSFHPSLQQHQNHQVLCSKGVYAWKPLCTR